MYHVTYFVAAVSDYTDPPDSPYLPAFYTSDNPPPRPLTY